MSMWMNSPNSSHPHSTTWPNVPLLNHISTTATRIKENNWKWNNNLSQLDFWTVFGVYLALIWFLQLKKKKSVFQIISNANNILDTMTETWMFYKWLATQKSTVSSYFERINISRGITEEKESEMWRYFAVVTLWDSMSFAYHQTGASSQQSKFKWCGFHLNCLHK